MSQGGETGPLRSQRTIRRAAQMTGIGFFTGADVTIHFLPAPANHGIAFQRVDLPGTETVPALIEYAVPRQRRTALERQGATVEMTEHVLAALAGLQIDNCLVQLNAPEPPGCDGSSLPFAEALLDAEIVEQAGTRRRLMIENNVRVCSEDRAGEITAAPLQQPALSVAYQLDYGPGSPIPPQSVSMDVTPETFLRELAFARTFVLESEVDSLRKQGYGLRTTAEDLLVFGSEGVIGNQLRAGDECARHKILDCIGDYALLGCDLCGEVKASRSGHQLNRELVRRLKMAHPETIGPTESRAA